MEFTLTKTSSWNYKEQITLNTLEELLALQKKEGELIIMDDNKIEIYDDYGE